MKIPVDLRPMKPGGVRRCAAMLAPNGSPLSRPLAAWLRGLSSQIDAILDAGGEGAVALDLRGLDDEDLHRLGIRLYAVVHSLDFQRDGPFLELVGRLRASIDVALLLRAVI